MNGASCRLPPASDPFLDVGGAGSRARGARVDRLSAGSHPMQRVRDGALHVLPVIAAAVVAARRYVEASRRR